jgi:hypothetical protein
VDDGNGGCVAPSSDLLSGNTSIAYNLLPNGTPCNVQGDLTAPANGTVQGNACVSTTGTTPSANGAPAGSPCTQSDGSAGIVDPTGTFCGEPPPGSVPVSGGGGAPPSSLIHSLPTGKPVTVLPGNTSTPPATSGAAPTAGEILAGAAVVATLGALVVYATHAAGAVST